MISALYMEEAVRHHPRARLLQSRFPNIPHIPCDHYGEVFNRRGQDFRLQKARPALILAENATATCCPHRRATGSAGR